MLRALILFGLLGIVGTTASGIEYEQRVPIAAFSRHNIGTERWDAIAEGVFEDDGRSLTAETRTFFADILLDFDAFSVSAPVAGAQDIVRARISVDPTGSWIEGVVIILYERNGQDIEFREQLLFEATNQTGGTRIYAAAFDRSLISGEFGVLVSIFKHDLDTPVRIEAVDILALTSPDP